jgi:ketosteroid isomerase-like protein
MRVSEILTGAMSEESTTPDLVELRRTFYATMDREWDFDALAGRFAPDAVWDLSESHLGIYEGLEAIGDFLVRHWATWEDHHHEIEEIRDFGDGVLSVAIREDGCPRGSDGRVQARHVQVFEWVRGEIVRVTGYPDSAEGRAAAERLAESTGSAMPRESVEVVWRGFQAWNAPEMDALRELYDPGVIWRPPQDWPEPGPYVGREAVMRQLEQLRETWDADALEPISDFISAADRVVVRIILRGVGHGLESNIELTGVYTVRKGRIPCLEFFWDHAEALKAVGLAA